MKAVLSDLLPLLRVMKDREVAALGRIQTEINAVQARLDHLWEANSASHQPAAEMLRQADKWRVEEQTRLTRQLLSLLAEREEVKSRLGAALARQEIVARTADPRRRTGPP